MCLFLPVELFGVPPKAEPPNGFLFGLAVDDEPPPRPLRNPPPPPPPKIELFPPLDSAGLDAPKVSYTMKFYIYKIYQNGFGQKITDQLKKIIM